MHACVSVMTFSPTFLCIISLLLCTVSCKVYNRCELARELVEEHEIPANQVATWVCIAYRESGLNTSAVNHGSGDHGLFQISERWWCSPPGEGYACAISCAALEDDDIEDDVVCARRIFRAHQRISGDGFSAWVVYPHYCKDKEKVKKYVEGCFDAGTKITTENQTLSSEKNKFIASTASPTILPVTRTKPTPSTIESPSKATLKESPIVTYKYVSTGLIKGVSLSPPYSQSTAGLQTSEKQHLDEDGSRNKIKGISKESDNTAEKKTRMIKNAYSIFVTPNGFRLTRSENSK